MIEVGKVLVCGRYPCMSHSGRGVRCSTEGCTKYVRPVPQGEKGQMMCVFHRDTEPKRCIHPGCVNMTLQGDVCQCHGANTKFCAITSRCLMSLQTSEKSVDATTMLEREDFVSCMVQTSLYQHARDTCGVCTGYNAPTKCKCNPEMEKEKAFASCS
jgi:hypothetical protein